MRCHVLGLIAVSSRLDGATSLPALKSRSRAGASPAHPRPRAFLFIPRGGAAFAGDAGANLARTVLGTAARKALSGGLTGSVAGVAQVLTFMWLRTAMNYQYRHGGSSLEVLSKLWAEGGVRRLYRGLPFALVQGPLSRFGSAASNTLVLGLREADVCGLGAYPVFAVTLLGSLLTALFRVLLMPIDVLKTVSQVEGPAGYRRLTKTAFRDGDFTVLYTGALAMAAATLIGHYPWFVTFNMLDVLVPRPDSEIKRAGRAAAIGFVASIISDVVSNPVRVLKTVRQGEAAQGADKSASYGAIVLRIIEKDGVSAFFTRGLSTRIVANGLQSIIFTVVWRYLLGD